MAESLKPDWKQSTLLVLAIALHNAPEGLALGVAFGAAATNTALDEDSSLAGATALTNRCRATDLATYATTIDFVVAMALDVALR